MIKNKLLSSYGCSDIISPDFIRPNGARGAFSAAASSEGSPTKTFTDLRLREHPFVRMLRVYDCLLLFLFFPSCVPAFLACSFGLLKCKRFSGLPAFSPCYFHRVTSPGHTLYCASYKKKKSEQRLLDSHLLRWSADAPIWKNNLCQILL